MGYRTKRDVLKSIAARKKVNNGKEAVVYDAYLGYDPYSKKQVRMQSADLQELKSRIERFFITHRIGGDVAVRLKPNEAMDAREALDILASRGIKSTLTDIVQKWLGGSALSNDRIDKDNDKRIDEAYNLFLGSLIGKSEVYIKALKSRVGNFVKSIGKDTVLSSISAPMIVKDIKSRVLDEANVKTWKTYNNHLGDIKTFLAWCAKPQNGFIAQSPLIGVDKISIPYHNPEYMRAEDVAALFKTLALHANECPCDLADAILSFFCGMRQSEIERVRDGDEAVKIALDATEPFIRVVKVKGSTRGARPRVFKISQQALAWMRSFDFCAAVKMPNNNFRDHLIMRAEEAGISVPKNAGRHTFITMHAAAYHDQNLLSSIVGNTEGVRANSYDGVEVETNGRAYFAIMPN